MRREFCLRMGFWRVVSIALLINTCPFAGCDINYVLEACDLTSTRWMSQAGSCINHVDSIHRESDKI